MGGVVDSIFGGGGGGGGSSSTSNNASSVTVNPTTTVNVDNSAVATMVQNLTTSNQQMLTAVEVLNQAQMTKMSNDFTATMTSLQDHMAQSDKLNLLIAAGSIAYLVFGHKVK